MTEIAEKETQHNHNQLRIVNQWTSFHLNEAILSWNQSDLKIVATVGKITAKYLILVQSHYHLIEIIEH